MIDTELRAGPREVDHLAAPHPTRNVKFGIDGNVAAIEISSVKVCCWCWGDHDALLHLKG